MSEDHALLGDFIEQKESESTEQEEDDSGGNVGDVEEYPNGSKYRQGSVSDHVEYGDIEKPCPSCGCLSWGFKSRTFYCPNEECGTINFTQGWNERHLHHESIFMSGVEIEGWRHPEFPPLGELPPGVEQEPEGYYNYAKHGGDDHACPECGSTFSEFYSANYCPVCKEKVKGRTKDSSSGVGDFL